MLHLTKRIIKWLRSLWSKPTTDAPVILSEWKGKQGRCLKITRNVPTAISTYKYLLLGESKQLFLFIDNAQAYRRIQRKRLQHTSTTDILLKENYSICITLLWNNFNSVSNTSITENIGIWCLALPSDEYDRYPEIVGGKLAYKLWSINHHGEGLYLFLKRIDMEIVIIGIVRDVIGQHHKLLIKRID